jgi:hypothetical protein
MTTMTTSAMGLLKPQQPLHLLDFVDSTIVGVSMLMSSKEGVHRIVCFEVSKEKDRG